MGGFSAKVQQPQTSGGGKVSSVAEPQQASSAVPTNKADIPYYMQDNFSTTNSQSNQSFNDTIRPMAKGGNYQSNATSGQPRIGQKNPYPNTVGQWDNTQQQTQQPMQGKGKGA